MKVTVTDSPGDGITFKTRHRSSLYVEIKAGAPGIIVTEEPSTQDEIAAFMAEWTRALIKARIS